MRDQTLHHLLLAALITTGCGADDTANAWTTTRDTLPGIARVVNVSGRGDAAYRIARGTLRGVTTLPLYPSISPVVRDDAFRAVVTDEYDVQYVVRGRLYDYLLPVASG